MALSENAKNWIFAVIVSICGYLYSHMVEIEAEIHAATQTIESQHVLLRLHLKDHESRLRVIENEMCGEIPPVLME